MTTHRSHIDLQPGNLKMVRAVAPSHARSLAPSLAPEESEELTSSTRDVVNTLQNAQRDLLLQADGHRLTEGVRRFCASQPLRVVQAIIGTAPALREEPGRRVLRLSAAEDAEMARQMGLAPTRLRSPGRNPETGRFSLGNMTPTQAREFKAAQRAAAKGAA